MKVRKQTLELQSFSYRAHWSSFRPEEFVLKHFKNLDENDFWQLVAVRGIYWNNIFFF